MLTDCNFLRWLISWHPWCSQKRTELVSDPSPNDVCYCADLLITKWNPDDLYPFCHILLLTLFTLHLMWSNLLVCDIADTNESRALGKYDICEMKWNDNPIIGLNFKNVTIFLGTWFFFLEIKALLWLWRTTKYETRLIIWAADYYCYYDYVAYKNSDNSLWTMIIDCGRWIDCRN